jgi:hypothetical protein
MGRVCSDQGDSPMIIQDTEELAKLTDFISSKKPEEPMRDAVIRYFMEVGASSGHMATKDVGVIVNEADIGTVDCVLAGEKSIAITYAEDKLGGVLGLWTLAEFAPKTAILVLNPNDSKLFPYITAVIRRSKLLANSFVKFVVLDIKERRKETTQRKSQIVHHEGRRKRIVGERQPHKKQD